MNVVVVVLIIVAALFALVFFTKRRFGVLGLALAAGALLSGMWATDATPYIQQAGLQVVAPPMETLVAAAMILLPAIVLLFSGPKYSKMSQRVIGSAAFALLAAAFLLDPLGGALVLTGNNQDIYKLLADHHTWIITAGILFALFDLLTMKPPKPPKEK